MKSFTHPNEEDLSAFIDGMLELPEMLQVGVHVDSCEACRAACEAFSENKHRMRALAVTPVESAAFWAGAFAKLEAEAAQPVAEPAPVPSFETRPVAEQKQRPSFRVRWAYPAAAAAAVLLVSVVTRTPMTSQVVPTAHPPAVGITQPAPSEAQDAVDVAQLVWSHTSSASQQPLADSERQAMLAAENDPAPSEAGVVADELYD